jgi:ribosomal protein S18 acetylase RimI-like enzyme
MVSDIDIQLATKEDVGAIAAMSRAEIERNLPWRWTPSRVREAIEDTKINVAIARKHGLLGGFGIMRYDEEVASLDLLAVHPLFRRQGMGSSLLVWLEKVAIVAGAMKIKVEAREKNTIALAFYRAHGYSEIVTEQGMYYDLENGVRLEKIITCIRSA